MTSLLDLLTPCNDWLLIRRDKPSANRAGLVLPENARGDRYGSGVIAKVGPLCKDYRPGQRVLFGNMATIDLGDPLEVKAEEQCAFLPPREVLGILHNGIDCGVVGCTILGEHSHSEGPGADLVYAVPA